MEKEEILKKIENAINTEEKAVPIYAKHLQSTMFWSGFDKIKQKLIIERLQLLEKDSLLHAKMFQDVKSIYLERIN